MKNVRVLKEQGGGCGVGGDLVGMADVQYGDGEIKLRMYIKLEDYLNRKYPKKLIVDIFKKSKDNWEII